MYVSTTRFLALEGTRATLPAPRATVPHWTFPPSPAGRR
jgi:hypothetical protein